MPLISKATSLHTTHTTGICFPKKIRHDTRAASGVEQQPPLIGAIVVAGELAGLLAVQQAAGILLGVGHQKVGGLAVLLPLGAQPRQRRRSPS